VNYTAHVWVWGYGPAGKFEFASGGLVHEANSMNNATFTIQLREGGAEGIVDHR